MGKDYERLLHEHVEKTSIDEAFARFNHEQKPILEVYLAQVHNRKIAFIDTCLRKSNLGNAMGRVDYLVQEGKAYGGNTRGYISVASDLEKIASMQAYAHGLTESELYDHIFVHEYIHAALDLEGKGVVEEDEVFAMMADYFAWQKEQNIEIYSPEKLIRLYDSAATRLHEEQKDVA